MEQCVHMGRPALAVKVYSEMRKAGIHPSAVTYGFYNKAIMEGKWPSTKRRWNVLKIVFGACFFLRELHKRASKERGSFLSLEETQANFRLLQPSSSELSVSALDVAVDDLPSQSRGGLLSIGSVYRLSSPSSEQCKGDYAVRGDSFYIADKSPLLRSHDQPIKTGFGFGRTSSTSTVGNRMYRRMSTRSVDGASIEVCLCSCSQCPNCQSLIYDEEIMICWSEGSAAEYNINCPYCNKSLVPSLNVHIRKVRNITHTTTC